MAVHTINKGLDLPILGAPEQVVDKGAVPRRVAILAADYVGMRPTMHVKVGENVRRGQLLFEDKKMPGVRFTSPAAGKVAAVNRGERRAFQSVVVELSRAEREGTSGGPDEVSFPSFTGSHPASLTGDQVRDLLTESGLWTALRARPFGKVADPATRPDSIFVTAIDTNPLAAAPQVVLAGREADFERGLTALGKLTDGPVFVCAAPGAGLALPSDGDFRLEEFVGPHPAGTAGLHIHTLQPVGRQRQAWHLNYQDVLAIGSLFRDGRLAVERVVALGGPVVKQPRLLATRIGASVDDLVAGELEDGDNRVISGSVLSGTRAMGGVFGYLGRYSLQISAVAEDRSREFLGWMGPGVYEYSTINTFVSRLIPGRKFAMTTSTHGSHRAIVPIGMYEKVTPFDIEPTFLLKALVMGDVEKAEEMGCLEFAEEDLSLLSFVCPGKYEFGPYLRNVLTIIEKEG